MSEEHQFNAEVAKAAFESKNPQVTPGGYCNSCGQAQMKINGEFTCPNCSTLSKAPVIVEMVNKAGEVVKRVTEEEALRLEGRLNKVKKVDARLGINTFPTQMEKEAAEIEAGAAGSKAKLVEKEAIPPALQVDVVFKWLDAELQQAKFNSMVEAKKILKLRQKLALFKLELGDFLGGK